MSAANCAGLSAAPEARCTAVPAPGMKPDDSAVLPRGVASRSSSTQSMPRPRRNSAAVSPQAPAPTMATGTCGVLAGICAARTTRASTSGGGPVQVLAARLAQHAAVLEDFVPAQEGGIYARRQLEALERRVALR